MIVNEIAKLEKLLQARSRLCVYPRPARVFSSSDWSGVRSPALVASIRLSLCPRRPSPRAATWLPDSSARPYGRRCDAVKRVVVLTEIGRREGQSSSPEAFCKERQG